MEYAHTLDDLKRMQAYPLDIKIELTRNRICSWIRQHDAFVSFSGGKDSSVLLHIARQVDPHIPAVFLNTRTEHRSLCEVVRATDNVTKIFPDITFAEAVEQCGWCAPNKEIAAEIYGARVRQYPSSICAFEGKNSDGSISTYRMSKFVPYEYLLDAPFKISDMCCDRLKKDPIMAFEKSNHMTSIVGTLAAESQNRRRSWLKRGCNAWNAARPISRPLSFWTDGDVLEYIQLHDLPIAAVYGQIKQAPQGFVCSGQKQSGCVPCPVGSRDFSKVRLSKFEQLARDDPMYHAGLMRSKMGLREVLLWIHAPLGCTACGGRCHCCADPYAPKWKTK